VSQAFVGVLCGVGAAHLVAYYSGHRAIAGVLKSLPVLALAATVAAGAVHAGYGRLVTAGLLASAVGDVCLVFPSGFLFGLGAFLLGHLCYVGAFASGAVVTGVSLIAAAALGVAAGLMLRYLWPHVRSSGVRWPVVVYMAAISAMSWCAIASATAPGAATAAVAGAIGAVTFMVSDGVLAVNRFARPFEGAHALVMVTYYAAQMLIARSAL
jgi:uncharacterized membrane protein YhhN